MVLSWTIRRRSAKATPWRGAEFPAVPRRTIALWRALGPMAPVTNLAVLNPQVMVWRVGFMVFALLTVAAHGGAGRNH